MKLKKNKQGTLHTTIQDIEGDSLKLKFYNDDCVHINTKGLSYITIGYDQLFEIAKLIEKAEVKYGKSLVESK